MQAKIQDSGYAPSFSCYSSDSTTSTAVHKAIREDELARLYETEDVDFEFLSDEQVSVKRSLIAFPVFNRDLLINDDVVGEIKARDDGIEASSAIIDSLGNMFIDKRGESCSCSSSEADELESVPYCVWRPTKCKKSSSTGSGSKRWRFRYLLRRSNSEPKKADIPKQKRNSGGLQWKAQTPVHEQFYVQRRAENEVGKRKSYLPYRKDLVGLFSNVNGIGKILPF
ncbi:hypothetical protein L1987_17867 [Smallanthus sonchifolius]|uniref:Uncharacterized protein n=1 Tax=Smallanthus sonchifolius TaxID=185202 RepID=A0ACB9IYR8_9ASTR|nr:hypothetical protein L1987_17867 [Smallanthus sonchifolius]